MNRFKESGWGNNIGNGGKTFKDSWRGTTTAAIDFHGRN